MMLPVESKLSLLVSISEECDQDCISLCTDGIDWEIFTVISLRLKNTSQKM